MSDKLGSLDEVVAAALRLSPIEKVRLVERVVSTLESDVVVSGNKPLETYYGLCADLGSSPSAEDVDEVRREMLKDFPREDIEF